MAKVEIEEIKTYKCSDGSIYDSKDDAEAHEAELKDPNYSLLKRIDELERRLVRLEGENLKRIEEISCIKQPFKLNKEPNPYDIPNRVWYGVGQDINEAFDNLKEVK